MGDEHRSGSLTAPTGTTGADVGRMLSRERIRQGLSLQDVGLRTGIPVDELRAAETGVLERPDALDTLKTVRRFADCLGLPGDRYALAVLERWPKGAGVGHPFARTGPQPATELPTSTGEIDRGRPDQRANRTAEVAPTPATRSGERTRGAGAVLSGQPLPRHGDAGGFDAARWGAYSDTGPTPAVKAPADHVRHRQGPGVPRALPVLVVLVVLAVLVGAALLAVDRLEPSWLRAVGLARTAGAGAPPPTHTPPPAAHTAAATASVLRPNTGNGAAVFHVQASAFNAKLTSHGGPCWVEVSADTSSTPVYMGVIEPGRSHTFSGVRSLVVEIGSTSGRLSISSSGGRIATYAPPGAPYKVVVRTAH